MVAYRTTQTTLKNNLWTVPEMGLAPPMKRLYANNLSFFCKITKMNVNYKRNKKNEENRTNLSVQFIH